MPAISEWNFVSGDGVSASLAVALYGPVPANQLFKLTSITCTAAWSAAVAQPYTAVVGIAGSISFPGVRLVPTVVNSADPIGANQNTVEFDPPLVAKPGQYIVLGIASAGGALPVTFTGQAAITGATV